ncbi:MAG: PQQ-dependent sugar dehydrogenase, partial [Wenzhouxiangellaceae bacterium]|nr:PQQ-dependent sugar dehydrogenase [Wenzhouxiangellaceae bacterium]
AREAIWQHEHGPRGGDELQRLVPGSNYGWPAATHGIDYSGALISPYESLPGRVDPLWTWTPSIAPAGLAVVEGPAFPAWQGDLLVTGLASRDLRRLEISGERVVAEHVLLAELDERLREVRIAPDGTPWITTDSDRGRVLRLVPAGFESQRATEPTT